MDLREKRPLGNYHKRVGRLGVASGYGAPAEAFEEAFEKGCNYFYWGSVRRSNMGDAIKRISARGQREELLVVIQVYNRIASMMAGSVERGLKKGGLDYVDVLLLGWYNSPPAARIIKTAQRLKESGKVRLLGMSGHHRPAFVETAETGVFDLFHVRYNAAHRGAEQDVFPKLPPDRRPAVVTYTATCWGQLLKPVGLPAGVKIPRSHDCYRFVLSNSEVDVCLAGPANRRQMWEALKALELGPLDEREMEWIKKVGDRVKK